MSRGSYLLIIKLAKQTDSLKSASSQMYRNCWKRGPIFFSVMYSHPRLPTRLRRVDSDHGVCRPSYTPTIILISGRFESINKPPTRSNPLRVPSSRRRTYLNAFEGIFSRVTRRRYACRVKPSTCAGFTRVRHMCVMISFSSSSSFISILLPRHWRHMCALRRTYNIV